ncbi:MAG: hypothetical protein Q4C46_11465 [Bacillota bacterium]|nr:hypothetical protein [Bacillota bacterium]
MAHKEQEPIFITKNGYSDLVVMSSELYDKFARINRIGQAIFESEQEIANGFVCTYRFNLTTTHNPACSQRYNQPLLYHL